MRFTERFLVVFAFLSILMRLWGMKDGPTLELIAMPLLALFYLITMPFLTGVVRRSEGGRVWGQIIIGVLSGVAIAYCIISLMLYTLGWLPKADMLVNCSILLGLLIIAGIIGRKRGKWAFYINSGLRAAILLGIIVVISLLPLPHIGSLSRGAF